MLQGRRTHCARMSSEQPVVGWLPCDVGVSGKIFIKWLSTFLSVCDLSLVS